MPWEPMLYKLGAWCPDWYHMHVDVVCCCVFKFGVVVVKLSNNLMSCYWKIMWTINIVKLLLFMLLNSVDELYTYYYYWMWISPLLFECCLYVGNVQIIRFSCCRDLNLSHVVLGSLLYVTGWGYCIVFHLLRIIMNYVDEPFEMEFQ